jgi:hypothetical protein
MEIVFKTAYYCGTIVITLVFAFFFLANLFDSSSNTAMKCIFLGSGSVAIGFLVWSMRLGHFGGQWLVALAVAGIGLALFGVLTVAGIFAFTRVHWQ